MTKEENDFLRSLAESQFREPRQQAQMIFTNALVGLMRYAAQPRNAGDVAPMGGEEKSSGNSAQRA